MKDTQATKHCMQISSRVITKGTIIYEILYDVFRTT